ncbi:MAG: 30S ribosomal protein S12 methylthiotransferase RimO [Candidatus Omnitrophota bacterium]
MGISFSIISLGCPRNLVDSERIASEFRKKGCKLQEDVTGSDVLIINTCAFIEDAKRESIDVILKAIDAKKEGRIKKIIVAGCLSERYGKELAKELGEVDEFRGVLDFKDNGAVSKLTPAHYAYVKISEGCVNRCSYCVIPYLKGPYKSRTIRSIKDEVAGLVKKGAREIVLVGQDTSLYGIDLYKNKKLACLLRDLARNAGDAWIRVLYLHPANLDKEVIKVIRDNENICRYVDLPLEHINDNVLSRMKRRAKKKEIVSLLEFIRKEIPGVALRTSLIVGFPGETEREFRELADFVNEMEFERLGVFKYSREEGTPAYNYEGQISDRIINRRFDEIMSLQQRISARVNERFKGRTLKVLVEEKKEGCYLARTEYDAPEVDGMVYVKGKGLSIGNFADVRITDTYEYDLAGEVVR